MPNGVPVATVALNAAKNAGILAAQILATNDIDLSAKLSLYRAETQNNVEEKIKQLAAEGWKNGFDNFK